MNQSYHADVILVSSTIATGVGCFGCVWRRDFAYNRHVMPGYEACKTHTQEGGRNGDIRASTRLTRESN